MSWKNWPTWLKGGAIGLLFSLAVSLLALAYFAFCYNDVMVPSYCPSISFLGYPQIVLFFLNSYYLNYLFYILVGIVIGYLIDKFKNRKGVTN